MPIQTLTSLFPSSLAPRLGAAGLLLIALRPDAGADGGVTSLPLAELARPEKAPLLEKMDPQSAGLWFENEYSHPQRWTDLWHQYFLGTIGTGVALGDVSGRIS